MNGLLYLEFDRKKASEIFTAPGLAETAEELLCHQSGILVQRMEKSGARDAPCVAEFIIGMAFAGVIGFQICRGIPRHAQRL